MDYIKRKILLENSIDRQNNSSNWGSLTATSFYIKVMLTQNMDDMGLFTDIDYVGLTGATANPITGLTTGTNKFTIRDPKNIESTYYNYGNSRITGYTDSKIEDVKSYDTSNPYQVGFNISEETYELYNYSVEKNKPPLYGIVDGVSRVTIFGEPSIYVFDALDDSAIGTKTQPYGILYEDYTGTTRTVTIDGIKQKIPQTSFSYVGEGINETNVSLSALTKEEYLFGIISRPEVQSDVFIDRGITTVFDKHLRLSEIKNLGQLSRYGNGYYNLTKE